MTKKKSFNVFMVLLLVAAIFASCSNEVGELKSSEAKYVDLSVEISGESKAIDTLSDGYATGLAVASYEYKAACTSTPGAQGTQSSWLSLTVSEGAATLEQMARGDWTIEVRAKNSAGGVILYGTANIANLSTNNDTLAITLKNDITGNRANNTAVTVSFGVTVPKVTGATASLKYVALADIATLGSGTSVSLTATASKSTTIDGNAIALSDTVPVALGSISASGMTAYTGTVDLQPGLYVMQFQYIDPSEIAANQVMSGQTFAFRVTESQPFAINGTLTAGELIDLELSPITVDDRTITVSFSTAAACNETTLTATLATPTVAVGTLASTSYVWFVDGVQVTNAGTNPAFSLAYTKTGTHVLTCVVTGTIDGVAAVGYAHSQFVTE
jgi:hypothetical protein